jgi:hypothetical protein
LALSEEETNVVDPLRLLMLASAVLVVVGTMLMSYPVLFAFKGREYGDVTADGSVSKLPEYARWQARSDKLYRVGLVLVTLSAGIQIALTFWPTPSSPSG